VVGIGGIAFLPNNVRLMFADLTDEARQYPMALHKAGLATVKLAKEMGIPRVVATSETHPAGERWLLRLGFEKREINGLRVYVLELP
jgi:FMN phosphatase YigB (HAD superfamily)